MATEKLNSNVHYGHIGPVVGNKVRNDIIIGFISLLLKLNAGVVAAVDLVHNVSRRDAAIKQIPISVVMRHESRLS